MTRSPFSIRLDPHQRAALEQLAERDGASVGDVIRGLIDERVNAARVAERTADTPVTLSPLKRYELAAMHDILAAVDQAARAAGTEPGTHPAGYHESAAEILRSGYTGSYGRLFQGLHDELPLNECRLAWDILDMFRSAKFTPDISAETLAHVTYRGLDGHSPREAAIAGYIEFLIGQGRWAELHDDVARNGGESIGEMLPTYEAMLRVFKSIQREAMGDFRRHGRLTAEEFAQVARAGR